MIVHLSAEAEHDLEAIGDFIALENPTRALSFARRCVPNASGWARCPSASPWFRTTKPQACGTVPMAII